MAANDFILLGLWEWITEEKDPQPGSWAHYTQVIPPFLNTFWKQGKLA
jgi:hypothetical protein